MNLTTKYVAEAGLVQAGVGQSLAEAREAKFLETPKGARGPDLGRLDVHRSLRAGRTRGDMPARPGLNPLRFDTITTVTPSGWRRCARWPPRSTAAPAADGPAPATR